MQTSDPRAIKALAHPLRLDLLELLTATGPATAAHCGRMLGVPQANCSFHLRLLAKYGFVEEAEPGPDRRERRWRVPEKPPAVRVPAGGDPVVRREFAHLTVGRETAAIRDYLDRADDESPDWRSRAGMVSAVAVLSAEEAAALKEGWKALIQPYLERTGAEGGRPAPGRRLVRLFMAATPTADLGPQDRGEDSDD